MNKHIQALFSIIRKQIMQKEETLDFSDFTQEDYAALYEIAKSHDIAHIVGAFFNEVDCSIPKPIQDKFYKQYILSIYRYEEQQYEIDCISKLFLANNVDFILLKGSKLKHNYPQPYYRTSSDIDVLVKEEEFDRALALLVENLHYKKDQKGSHDITLYSESDVHIELHFSLTHKPSEKSILHHVWESGELQSNQNEYQMSAELFYFYHVYHMGRHFLEGGCGIKTFMDLWVMKRTIPCDRGKLERLMKEDNLYDFFVGAEKLTEIWFEGAEYTDLAKDMEDYILEGGVYGSLEQHVAMSQTIKGGRLKHLLSKIFLPYRSMLIYYPSLKKCPLLFPFYQVRRWFRIAFCGGRKRALMEIKINQSMTDEKKEKVKRLINELNLKK